MRAYFTEGVPIGDRDALSRSAAEIGLDPTRRAPCSTATLRRSRPRGRAARPADRHPGRAVLRPRPPLRRVGRAAGRRARAGAGEGVRLSVLDQSPVPEGSTGPDALRNTLDLARLADELGYHRYWLAEHHGAVARRAEPGGADRARRGRDRAHPRRQRRRDAAALLAVQGRRELQPARRPVPGPDRPRDRPRLRHRPADHLRAPARPPPGLARRLPAAARRAARALRRQPARRPPVRAGSATRSRAATSGPRCGCSAPRRRARSGPASSACRTRSPTSSTRRAPRSPPTTGSAAPSGGRARAVAVWAICAETDEEAERLASSIAMAMAMLRQDRPIPVPPPEKALRYLAQNPGSTGRPPPDRRLARDGARRDRGGRLASTAPTR